MLAGSARCLQTPRRTGGRRRWRRSLRRPAGSSTGARRPIRSAPNLLDQDPSQPVARSDAPGYAEQARAAPTGAAATARATPPFRSTDCAHVHCDRHRPHGTSALLAGRFAWTSRLSSDPQPGRRRSLFGASLWRSRIVVDGDLVGGASADSAVTGSRRRCQKAGRVGGYQPPRLAVDRTRTLWPAAQASVQCR